MVGGIVVSDWELERVCVLADIVVKLPLDNVDVDGGITVKDSEGEYSEEEDSDMGSVVPEIVVKEPFEKVLTDGRIVVKDAGEVPLRGIVVLKRPSELSVM